MEEAGKQISMLQNEVIDVSIGLVDLNTEVAAGLVPGNHVFRNHFVTELQLFLVHLLVNSGLREITEQ